MIHLSIIIVNWNTKDYLLRCIESILQSGRKISWELIIVDNGSQDGSVEEVRERFTEINLIENSENMGFAKATDQGIKRSTGKYILLANPDTRVEDKAIERLLAFMDSHPETGVSGPQLLNGDGSKQNSIANFPSLATELLNKSLLKWLFPNKYPGKGRYYRDPIEVDSVIGACMMVRRTAIEQVGLLDEDYFLFLEETDWCYRMKRAGWKIYHVPQAEVYHYQGKSVERERKKAKLEYYRSRYLFFKKNRGSIQWYIVFVGLMIKLLFEFILATVGCIVTLFTVEKWKRKFSTYAYLMWWHLRLCPSTMGLRKVNPKL
jgi:GT2 family glycosyltransferase